MPSAPAATCSREARRAGTAVTTHTVRFLASAAGLASAAPPSEGGQSPQDRALTRLVPAEERVAVARGRHVFISIEDDADRPPAVERGDLRKRMRS